MEQDERIGKSIEELFREYETGTETKASATETNSGNKAGEKLKNDIMKLVRKYFGNKPQDKKLTPKALLCAGLGALIVLGCLLVCLVGKTKGEAAFDRGDYQQAVSYFNMDFLFSADIKDKALYNLGLEYEKEGNFEQAVTCFKKLGDSAREEWAEASYKWASQLYQKDLPVQALAALKPIEREENMLVRVQNLRTKIVRGYIAEDMLTEAENVLAETNDELMSNGLVVLGAVIEIKHKDYDAALQLIKDAGFDSPFARALDALDNKNYYEAAEYALELGKVDGDLISTEEWKQIILERIETDKASYCQLDAQLSAMATMVLLNEPREIIGRGELSGEYNPEFRQYKEFVSDILTSTRFYNIGDGDTLFSRCALRPTGKALVVRQQKLYPEDTDIYAVDLMASAALPDELVPSCLEEVEYLIVYAYDYSKHGPYSYTENVYNVDKLTNYRTLVDTRTFFADEIILTARVSVKRLTDDYRVYDSWTLNGGDEAETGFRGQGDDRTEREWFINEPPEIEDGLVQAVDVLYKFINK